MRPFSLNINGELRIYRHPVVMGILNVTPDSFYEKSRATTAEAIAQKVQQMIDEGVDIIDVGAYSTRPGSTEVSVKEELDRLELGMEALRSVAPDIPVSVDTFRSEVARTAVKELSANIINDISSDNLGEKMMETVADLQVPYVLMHMRGTPSDMQDHTDYDDLIVDIMQDLAAKIGRLSLLGVNDVIIDPGFGFSKTMEQNYEILKNLSLFDLFYMPILVGISRKSMITKLLDVDTDQSLIGTAALNMTALQNGASILRVHDVKAAKQVINLQAHL